ETGELCQGVQAADDPAGLQVVLFQLQVAATGVADPIPHQYLAAALLQAPEVGGVALAVADAVHLPPPAIDMGLVGEVEIREDVKIRAEQDLGHGTAD